MTARHLLLVLLAIVAAFLGGLTASASTSRPVQQSAPIAPAATGFEEGVVPSPAAAGRTAAPTSGVASVPPATPAPDRQRAERKHRLPGARPAGHPATTLLVAGWSTWYAWRPGEAAAGPALRRALGPGWRGSIVTVCAHSQNLRVTCARVVLSDWCLCGSRHGRPTVIDLDARTFARLAPLSRGVIRVEVRR